MDPADSNPLEMLSGSVQQIRIRTLEATSRLLGDTIALSDQEWQHPSTLAWWTRAHVATHIARNADALRTVATGALAGQVPPMYESEVQRDTDIERGSLRAGLDIQIDLDTSAGRLSQELDRLPETEVDPTIDLAPGIQVRLSHLPLVRLNEVVLHHNDLQLGFTLEQLSDDVARWLLEWRCHLLSEDHSWPAVVIASDSGLTARIGGRGSARTVQGTDARLLAWLVGRVTGPLPVGSEVIPVPHPA